MDTGTDAQADLIVVVVFDGKNFIDPALRNPKACQQAAHSSAGRCSILDLDEQ